jgi:capsular polysaccharide transport system permease protein
MPHSQPIIIPKHSPLVSQYLVIRALIGREITTRFGKYRLGFFWMLLEPILGVVVMGVLFGTLIGRTVPEIPYAFFMLVGMVMLSIFTDSMRAGLNAIKANRGLLVYPNVKLLDPFIARFLYELLTSLFAFTVFCLIGMWMGIEFSFSHLHIVAAGFIITWLAGCGFGLLFGVGVAYYEELEKVVPVIQRPLLFLSAVMSPLAAVPPYVQKYLLLNPLVHINEICRHALFPNYNADGVDLLYPATFALVALTLGLTLFHNHRKFLSQS